MGYKSTSLGDAGERTHEMSEPLTTTAQRCLQASFDGTMDFPSIVRMLVEAGVEGYDVDFRRGTTTYFRATGESVQLAMPAANLTRTRPGNDSRARRKASRTRCG